MKSGRQLSNPSNERVRVVDHISPVCAGLQRLGRAASTKPLFAEDRQQAVAESLRGAPPAKHAWPGATSLEDTTAQVGAGNYMIANGMAAALAEQFPAKFT